jgi:hypothetical protein
MHQLLGMGEMRRMGEIEEMRRMGEMREMREMRTMREKIYLNLPHLPHLPHLPRASPTSLKAKRQTTYDHTPAVKPQTPIGATTAGAKVRKLPLQLMDRRSRARFTQNA